MCMITPEQVAEAKKNGLRVAYNVDGKPVRILSKEEIQKRKENWDEEFSCPKKLGELFRKVRARTEQMKKQKEI